MTCHRAVALAALALAALAARPAAAEESGDWIIRIRALHLDSADNDDTPLDLSLEDRWFPEIDFSYFFTPNWAAELVLTYPQRHDLKAGGTKIGDLKHLPPTLSLQYHVTGLAGFRPYVGAGVNYTHFSSVDLPEGVSIKRDSFGPALGAGVDVPLGQGWLLNFDAKRAWIDTEVRAGGRNLGDFGIDPWLLSVGFGRRF
jgi:outer membrane protein